MGTGEKSQLSASDQRLQKQLRLLGVFILVAGLLAAAVVHQRTAPDDGTAYLLQSGTILSGNAKRAENELRQIGGESNVIAAELQEWFDRQCHGRRLARTLAVLSLGGAAVCFSLAHLLKYPPEPAEKFQVTSNKYQEPGGKGEEPSGKR